MELLLRAPARLFPAEEIMERIWGRDSDAEIHVVWVHISNLRKKLQAIGSRVTIRAKRSMGYRLEEKPRSGGSCGPRPTGATPPPSAPPQA